MKRGKAVKLRSMDTRYCALNEAYLQKENSFAVNTRVHSVGISAVNDMGTKRFYFYDPNFSVVEFPSLKSLKKGLEAHFIMNGLADYYMAAGTQAKPEFNVINIDIDKMARVRVLPGQQVIDLMEEYPLSPIGDGDSIVTISDDESIVTIDDDESSVSTSESIMTIDDDESIMVLESSEQQIEQDLSLRMSLTKVAAYDHARKLSSAISKARTLYVSQMTGYRLSAVLLSRRTVFLPLLLCHPIKLKKVEFSYEDWN